MELAVKLFGELLKDIFNNGAVSLKVSPFFCLHASHLVSATEVECMHIWELLAERNRHKRGLTPDCRIRSGADVGVDTHDFTLCLVDNLGSFVGPFKPNTKR